MYLEDHSPVSFADPPHHMSSSSQTDLTSFPAAGAGESAESRGGAIYRNWMILPLLISGVLLLTALANPIQPVTETRTSSTNPILLFKLATAGIAWLIGAWGVWHSTSVRALFGSWLGASVLGISIVFLLTSVFAVPETATISRASALILFGYVLMMATTIVVLPLRQLSIFMLTGAVLFAIVTWFLYLFIPSIGEFHEYTGAGTTVTRMGGLAHPNSTARETAIALIIAMGVLRMPTRRVSARSDDTNPQVEPRRSLWSLGNIGWACLILFLIATLVATLSRTSALAAGAAIVMLLFDKLYGRLGIALLVAGITFGLLGFVITAMTADQPVSQSATKAITKSGDLEELTSLTGRTRIWGEAISLIADRPLTGYGLDSAASVMSKENVGTHNLVLHVIFSGGVMAGLAVLIMLASTLYIALSSTVPLFRGLSTYILVSGLVEDTLFSSFPCPITLLWIAMLLMIAMPSETQEASESPRRRIA